MVKNFTTINERLCVIKIKGRFFNYSLINIHAPTNGSEEEAKDQFYEQLERTYAACPSHDVKLVMEDANAKVGRETVHQPTIGMKMTSDWSTLPQANRDQKYVLHAQTNPPSDLALPRWTHLQPHRSMLDRRKTFSDVIDVMIMTRRGANIDSDHMLVVIKLRAKI
jgi:hypothetical protein